MYRVTVRYRYNAGKRQLPVAYTTAQQQQAGPDPTAVPYQQRAACEIVTVSQPIGRKIVKFAIVRMGVQPVAPSPLPANDNEVLLDAQVVPFAPSIQADGNTEVYGIKGRYVYALNKPLFVNDSLSQGSTQVDNISPYQTQLDGSGFAAGMI